MIEVKNLVKNYGGRNVVDDLSFTVEKGQIVGFLGPNGAGKSTTMNIITGYIASTSGTVTVNGYDIYDEPEKVKESIGYLPEQPPLYPDMRVREYLNFVADLKRVDKSEKEKMMYDIMTMTKIQDVSERLIKHLSKGYKQRVGLAGAMMGYPDILILDEPTVGLDPKQIIEIRNLILDLSKKHTILLSSHIMQEVSAVCNQIMIINQGQLIVSDTPDNIPNHINQHNELTLLVKGSEEQIQNILDAGEQILEYKVEMSKTEDCCNVLISTDVENDIREEIFFAFAKEGLAILEMNIKTPSLEEVFLRLTGSGTKQYGGKKEKHKLFGKRTEKKENSIIENEETAVESQPDEKEEK